MTLQKGSTTGFPSCLWLDILQAPQNALWECSHTRLLKAWSRYVVLEFGPRWSFRVASQFFLSCPTFSSLSLSLPQGKSASVITRTPVWGFVPGSRFLHGPEYKGECSQHLPAAGFESSSKASPNTASNQSFCQMVVAHTRNYKYFWHWAELELLWHQRKTLAHSSSPDTWTVSAGIPESGRLGLECWF